MAKGKKYNDDIKEQAIALLAINSNSSLVAEQMGLPRSTVQNWQRDYNNNAVKNGEEDLAKLRLKRKEEFVEDSWRLIRKCQKLLEKKIDRADADEEKDKTEISKISTVLGTLYDKQALANKEATQIIDGQISMKRFEDM